MKKTASIIFRSVILILIGITIGLFMSDNAYDNNKLGFSFAKNDKVSKALQLVRTTYVDSVNTDSIEGITVNNLLQNLDPHSLYLPPRQATSVNERLEGGYSGIGISYFLLRDTLFVTQLHPGGPADKAGITPGNKIIAINDKSVTGTQLTPEKIDNIFKDKNSETLQLTVLNNAGKLHTYTIKKRPG
jgi:carboxyl-terminal processing protease